MMNIRIDNVDGITMIMPWRDYRII